MESIEELREQTRLGVPGARLFFTIACVRALRGYLVAWRVPVEGAAVVWAENTRNRKIYRALAAIDLADAFDLICTTKEPKHEVLLFDLAGKRFLKEGRPTTPKKLEFSLEPPKGSPFKKTRAQEIAESKL